MMYAKNVLQELKFQKMHDIFDICIITYFFLNKTLIKENNLCQGFK